MNPLRLLFWIAAGCIIGAVVGIAVAVGLGAYSQWQNPTDPSAGSVAIVVIFTAPTGLFLGAIVGCIVGIVRM